MALKRRIIAKLLIDSSGPAPQLVKYKRFTENRRIAGDPVATARTLSDQKVDEFLVCDLGTISPQLVADMVLTTMTPVTAAGSIHTMEHVDALIQTAGADKVVVKNLELGRAVARKYGSQAWVYPFDFHDDKTFFFPVEEAGEILLTSIDRDGTGIGYQWGVAQLSWNVPVVLCGGAGKLSHVRDAFAAGADGCAISSMFFFSDKSPIKLRSWLRSEGANVRAA